ncbi:MAG TPA: hypothetical protein VE291_00765 [Terracidiphilus sp.]|jgi:hypothetical protein|nr:hypothetical protein [Terracidiphilus sp.]
MGLDGVEIVLRIEDEFSISLADEEARGVRTVGDLYELVLSKLDTTSTCLSSRAFYRTRQALVESLDVPRHLIRPSTELDCLLASPTRVQKWQEFSERIGLVVPGLHHSSTWKRRFLIIGMLFSGLVMLSLVETLRFYGWNIFDNWIAHLSAYILWLVWAGLFQALLLRLTPSLARETPVTTAGDLARIVLSSNFAEFAPSATTDTVLSKEYVWKRLVDIICEQQGLEPRPYLHIDFAGLF